MIGRRVIPCLLLNEGGLYKTVRFSDAKYVGDPINVIRIFNDKQVDEVIVLDIGAGRPKGSIDYELIGDFASECFMPLCYGGGIRSIEDIRRLFDLGLEKISINKVAAERPDLIAEAVETFGSQSIVVSIDVKSTRRRGATVVTNGGSSIVPVDPVTYAQRAQDSGAGEILLTAVHREGTGLGYDLELLRVICANVEIPVVAHGGAGSLRHLAEAFNAGASAVAAGSLFVFQGKGRAVLISYPSEEEQHGVFQSASSVASQASV